MQRIVISTKYPEEFVYKYLPSIFIQMCYKEINFYKNSKMNEYLKANYQVSLADISKYLNKIKVDKYKHYYIIHLDINDKLPNGKFLREIFHVMTYGRIDLRGLHIIDRSFEYICANIRYLYQMYAMSRSMIKQREDKQRGDSG